MSQEKNIDSFIDAICDLSKVNRLTGIWDNRRFQECKKEVDSVDHKFIYKTEKLSRANVELRGVARTNIDILYDKLLSK